IKAHFADIRLAHDRHPVFAIKEGKRLVDGPGLAVAGRPVTGFLSLLENADTDIHPVFLGPDQFCVSRTWLRNLKWDVVLIVIILIVRSYTDESPEIPILQIQALCMDEHFQSPVGPEVVGCRTISRPTIPIA